MSMEVTIQSMLSNVGGNASVTINPNDTILRLITNFCEEKEIPFRHDYVIQDKNHRPLKNRHLICDCGIQNGERLFITSKNGAEKDFCCRGCNQWWALGAVIFLIGLGGIITVSVLRATSRPQPDDYAVVLDAGSSHTQVFVYKWPADKENGTGIVRQEYTERGEGCGISNYTEDPQMAGKSIEHILDSAVKHVPDNLQTTTPIFLGATAGMRILNAADKSTSDKILTSVRTTMLNYPFMLSDPQKQARILDGSEEGTFSWVTANFLDSSFDKRSLTWHDLLGYIPTYTLGAMDLGGASTQMTFIPEDHVKQDYAETVTMYGTNYTVYSHSYLCYGLNEAYIQLLAHLVLNANVNTSITVNNISNPCQPLGTTVQRLYSEIFEVPCTNQFIPPEVSKNTTFTFIGVSDSHECKNSTSKIFDFKNEDCIDEPCSFNNVHQPEVFGTYYAFSGYWNTLSFLNSTDVPYRDFVSAMDLFCSKNWSQVSAMPGGTVYLMLYCFNAHFINSILIDGYHFTENTWENILFKKTIHGTDLGWTLGFTLNATNRFPVRYAPSYITVTVFVLLLLFFIIFIGIAFGFACHARQRQKDENLTGYERVSAYGAI